MADFYQTGVVATFHRFGKVDLDRMENELTEFNRHRPIALVLPSTYAELEAPAIKKIVEDIQKVTYLNEIVVTMGRTDEAQFKKAKKFFSSFPQRTRVIWNTGSAIGRLYGLLEENGLFVGDDGKGRSCWTAYGYILSREESKVIALHDCDIVNYSRELLGRLCYPVASPNIDYVFCKGYYARVTDRMHGRVTRLFVTPIIRSLEKLFGPLPLLVYLDSFRYPLAGEFSMSADLARINRIPADWGIEVETLAEVYRNCALKRICQVELCETYEHKHQPLSAENPKTGLMKMSIDIAKAIFRNLAIEGAALSESFLNTLVVNYLRTAQDTIKCYHDDAAINGLYFDRHQETAMVEAFTRAIQIAGQDFQENPLYSPLIPNWNRVTSAIPDFLEKLNETVEQENA
ncbi:MAG: glycosyl transferase [Candidatus Aminicenantes bacterium]|jgi:glucosyl-3-phosphoglycerate synthase|nr:glycosyl transferase [Candidatus Aminicenantes bacterium]MDH5467767.1 glycosyl transferase [Candidatus Aminicenantes bacterium]